MVSAHDLDRFDLLELETTAEPTRFRLPVRAALCTPFAFLYGGSGIAASVEASERATGRPLQWITTQFLGSPTPGMVVDLDVNVAVTGRATTQTQVSGTVDGVVMFTSLCAHNVRPAGDAEAFASMPDVPGPLGSARFDEFFDTGNASFFDHFERRIAAGKFAMVATATRPRPSQPSTRVSTTQPAATPAAATRRLHPLRHSLLPRRSRAWRWTWRQCSCGRIRPSIRYGNLPD